MNNDISESTFWTIFGITATVAIAIIGAIITWVRGLDIETNKTIEARVADSKRDRENIWDELRERADQYNRELANIVDRINVVKDTYVRRDDMTEKFNSLSRKFDQQAALIETVRNRIHDLANIMTSEMAAQRRERETSKDREGGEAQ